MATTLPNSPVNFGQDINTLLCNGSLGQPYTQLVQFGDPIMFQLPDICGSEICGIETPVYTPSGVNLAWTDLSSVTVTGASEEAVESDPLIYGIACTCEELRFCFDVFGLGSGRYLEVYKANGDVLTTLLGSYLADGRHCITVDSADVEKIAFVVKGMVGASDGTVSVTEVNVTCPCLRICIYDQDNNEVAYLPDSAYTFFNDVVQVSFNWDDNFEIPESFPAPLEPGCYRLVICEGDYTGVLTSQWYNLQEEHECTKLLSWTNDNDSYGFDYSQSLTHYLRVECILRNAKWSGEKETFTDSKGLRKVLYADKFKTKELVIREQPEYIHEALAIGIDHDHFYNPQYRQSSSLAPVIIETGKVEQRLQNKLC